MTYLFLTLFSVFDVLLVSPAQLMIMGPTSSSEVQFVLVLSNLRSLAILTLSLSLSNIPILNAFPYNFEISWYFSSDSMDNLVNRSIAFRTRILCNCFKNRWFWRVSRDTFRLSSAPITDSPMTTHGRSSASTVTFKNESHLGMNASPMSSVINTLLTIRRTLLSPLAIFCQKSLGS